MSYHGALGLPGISPTTAFAEAVDPYSQRFSPPGAIYAPYGWGPDFMIGMPMNYTHHLDYVREPVGGARYRVPGARPIGPMYDQLTPQRPAVLLGSYEGDSQQLGDSGDGLGGVLAVL